MKTKRIISFMLFLAIISSLFCLTTTSVSAAGKPTLSVTNVASGQKLTYDKNGNSGKMYLYIGYCTMNSKTGAITQKYWTRYREITGNSITLNWNTLHQKNWKVYINNVSIPQLKSGWAYCYQVYVGKINSKGKPLEKSYSSVKTMTFLAQPEIILRNKDYPNGPVLNHEIYWTTINGATHYELARANDETDKYESIYIGSDLSWLESDKLYGFNRYKVRALFKTEKHGTAKGAWSTIKKVYWAPSPYGSRDF